MQQSKAHGNSLLNSTRETQPAQNALIKDSEPA